MYRSSPFRSTLNTSYIRGLGVCKVPPISRSFPKTLAKTLKLRAKAQIHIFTQIPMEMWILIWCFSECPTNLPKIISKNPIQNIAMRAKAQIHISHRKYRWKCEFLSDGFLNVPPISRSFPKTLAKTLKKRAKAQIHIFTVNTDGNVNFNLMFFWMSHQFQDHFQKP